MFGWVKNYFVNRTNLAKFKGEVSEEAELVDFSLGDINTITGVSNISGIGCIKQVNVN